MLAITGHNGFIGSNLKKYFKEKRVNFILFQGDLHNKENVQDFFQKHTIKQAIFLAGAYGYDFQQQLEKNVLILQIFLEEGRKYGLQKVIYLSSGAVYGNPINKESLETDLLFPNTLYGLSKLFVEQCIQYYAQNYGLQYVILRLPNVYGKNNHKGVIFNFLSDIDKYKKITIAGDGSQQRNFLHVNDVCVAIAKAVSYKKSDIFNISNPKVTSVNDVVELLKKKYTFDIAYRPSENNLQKLILNIDKAKKLLKFEPSITNLDFEL